MAASVIIAKNQTGGAIALEDVGVTVPASGNLTLTDDLQVDEIIGSARLQDEVDLGNIILNDGTVDMSAAQWRALTTGNITAGAGPETIEVKTSVGASTTGTTPVQLPQMLITPPAGTWLVQFNGNAEHQANQAEVTFDIAIDGTPVADTERAVGGSNQSDSAILNANTQAVVTVDGTEEIQIRYWRTLGTGAVAFNERSLIVTRVS